MSLKFLTPINPFLQNQSETGHKQKCPLTTHSSSIKTSLNARFYSISLNFMEETSDSIWIFIIPVCKFKFHTIYKVSDSHFSGNNTKMSKLILTFKTVVYKNFNIFLSKLFIDKKIQPWLVFLYSLFYDGKQ